jgi:hypothetical protein
MKISNTNTAPVKLVNGPLSRESHTVPKMRKHRGMRIGRKL